MKLRWLDMLLYHFITLITTTFKIHMWNTKGIVLWWLKNCMGLAGKAWLVYMYVIQLCADQHKFVSKFCRIFDCWFCDHLKSFEIIHGWLQLFVIAMVHRHTYIILSTPSWGFSGIIYNTVWGDFARLLVAQFTINEVMSCECPRSECEFLR